TVVVPSEWLEKSEGQATARPKKFGTTVVVPSEWLENSEGRATARPRKFRHAGRRALRMKEKRTRKSHLLKSALKEFVINYGLKSVAWVCRCMFLNAQRLTLNELLHANGFSQWLMTNKLSAEIVRRKFFHAV
ncbi:MAG: hypothetical protein N3B10_14965, partial [Armatimonadetes bacterium]|nr:hypothetical protein [Armatimonadota bacterium]